jgi:hypothetical protein
MNSSNAFQCDVASLPPNVFQEGLEQELNVLDQPTIMIRPDIDI